MAIIGRITMKMKLIFIGFILILITVNLSGCNDINNIYEDDEKFSNWLGLTDEIISNLINLTFNDLQNKSSEVFLENLNLFKFRTDTYLVDIQKFNISENYYNIKDIYNLGLMNLSRALDLIEPYLNEDNEYLLTLIDDYFSNYFNHRSEALSLYIDLTGKEW